MRVHIAEFVEGRGRVRHEQGGRHPRADEDGFFDQVAHVVENIARVYGYAFLLVVWSVLFVIAICFPEYTLWPSPIDGGTSLASPASNGTVASLGNTNVPLVNQLPWSLYCGLLCPAAMAVRTMFATSCGDPHPLPGKKRFTWRYAP